MVIPYTFGQFFVSLLFEQENVICTLLFHGKTPNTSVLQLPGIRFTVTILRLCGTNGRYLMSILLFLHLVHSLDYSFDIPGTVIYIPTI